MVNEMTHIDKIMAFGQRVVDNLNAKGVNAELSDGALTLADKILDISTDTITFITSIVLSTPQDRYNQYDTININALLSTSRQNQGVILHGLLENGTIVIKENGQTLENITTNSNGIATYTIDEAEVGNYTYTAHYAGNTYFLASTSNQLNIQVIANHLAVIYKNRANYYYNGGSPNFTSFSNGILTASTTSGSVVLVPFTDQTDWEIEFDLWIDKGQNGFFYVGSRTCFSVGRNQNAKIEFQRNINGTKTTLQKFDNIFIDDWQRWNIKYTNGYFSVTIDGTTMNCDTQINDVLPYIGLRKYTNGDMRIKDFNVIEAIE